MADLLFLSLVIMAGFMVLLGLFVLRRGYRRPVNRFFFYFLLATVLWLLTNAAVQIAPTETLTFWVRTTFATAAVTMFVLAQFILIFPKPFAGTLPALQLLLFLPTVAVTYLSMGDLLVAAVERLGGLNVVHYGPIFYVFGIYIFLYASAVVLLAFWNYAHSTGIARQQILYLSTGIILGVAFASFTDLLAPLLGNDVLPNFGPLSLIFVAGFTSYAIVAHRLFDIRVIIKKTVIYSVLLTFVVGAYSLVIFTFASVFGTSSGLSRQTFLPNLLAALVVAFGFEPLRKWLVAATDKYLFVGEYRPEDVLRELSKTLSGVIDLDEALQGMMQILVKSMRLRGAATFVLRRFKGEVEVKRVKTVGFREGGKLALAKNDPLIRHFETRLTTRRDKNERRQYALVTEELSRRIDEAGRLPSIVFDVHKRLEELRAAVALPIIVKEQLIGILILSDKLSGDIFTSSDLDLLEIVAHETAGAIEKARFWEEDQLKSEFVSIASHELLTPTSTIQGYLSMILDEGMGKVDQKARGYLERVRNTSKRLTELVQDLLDVSRIEGGRIKVVPEPMDLPAVIRQVIDDLTQQAHQKGLSLYFEDPAKTSTEALVVFADPQRVRQILSNLISNAIKYTPKGGVTVSVERSGRKIKTNVTDTGAGISPEDKKHLFEKFFRIQNEATQGIPGTGLGLYIVKNVVELMGGTITAESEVGKGSTFSFTLPMIGNKHMEKR